MALEDPDGPWGDKIVELFEEVDAYIPEPQRANDKPFLMPSYGKEQIIFRILRFCGRVWSIRF